jgi:HlyD family secretion protein
VKKIRKPLLILIVLLVLGAAAWLALNAFKKPGQELRYRTAAVDHGLVQKRISANGTLNPVIVVKVGTQVSGTVAKLYVDFNQAVKAGQILLELDPALLQGQVSQDEANLNSADASLRLAQSTLARNEDLVAKGFISASTLDQNRKEVDVAKAQVAQITAQLGRSRTNLAYTVIRSPINGIITDRQIDLGQTVAASFSTPTLFSIANDLSVMQIDTSVAEADVGSIKEGMPVRFTVDAYPDHDFDGKVRIVRLNPTIQQNVVTYNVIVDVSNKDGLLKPGMTAQVSMTIAERADVVRIPNPALRFKPQSGEVKEVPKETTPSAEAKDPAATATAQHALTARVYKLDVDKKLIPVDVRTGVAGSQYTEMVSGDLKSGDQLVTRDLLARTQDAPKF